MLTRLLPETLRTVVCDPLWLELVTTISSAASFAGSRLARATELHEMYGTRAEYFRLPVAASSTMTLVWLGGASNKTGKTISGWPSPSTSPAEMLEGTPKLLPAINGFCTV